MEPPILADVICEQPLIHTQCAHTVRIFSRSSTSVTQNPWNIILYHAIPYNLGQYHAISYDSVQFHAIWRSVPVLCSHSKYHEWIALIYSSRCLTQLNEKCVARYWVLCIAREMKPVFDVESTWQTLAMVTFCHWVVSTTKCSLLKPFQFKWTFGRVIYDFPNKRRWWGSLMAGLPAIALMGLEGPGNKLNTPSLNFLAILLINLLKCWV